MIEKLKVAIWKLIYGNIYRYKYTKTKAKRDKLDIKDSLESVQFLAKNKLSVSRFGDGEFQIVDRYLAEKDGVVCDEVDTFQSYDRALGEKLYKCLSEKLDNHINAIPYAFKDASVFTGYPRIFFERETLIRLENMDKYPKQLYLDASFTRFYMDRVDIKDYPLYIGEMKKIWQDKDILFVEGFQSRLGVGNDLFDNAKSIKRILCPAKNAFSIYDKIMEATKNNANEETLILIALGQTATVLAYELAKEGYHAIDLGHIDVEYEWYRMQAKEKVAIKGKYVNEVSNGRNPEEIQNNDKYLSEIILDLSKN